MYKLARISRTVSKSGKSGSYEIPQSFSAANYVKTILNEEKQIAKVKVRNGTSLTLTVQGRELEQHDGWTLFEIPFESQVSFARTILWYGSDVEVVAPVSLREHLRSVLSEVAHG